jgi:hypothetical protein
MKVKCLLIIILTLYSFSNTLYGQDSSKMRQRNFIWTTPVKKNTTVNGIGIGLIQAVPWMGADLLKINGLNLDVSLFGGFGVFYALVGSAFAPFSKNKKTESGGEDISTIKIYTDTASEFATEIRGVSISLGGAWRDTKINGISLNGGVSFADEINGFEITTVMNLHYEFKGIMIAGLRNKVTKGKGLQLGLFNNCKEGRIFQIGLLNRIGNRILPICNFSFKRKT